MTTEEAEGFSDRCPTCGLMPVLMIKNWGTHRANPVLDVKSYGAAMTVRVTRANEVYDTMHDDHFVCIDGHVWRPWETVTVSYVQEEFAGYL